METQGSALHRALMLLSELIQSFLPVVADTRASLRRSALIPHRNRVHLSVVWVVRSKSTWDIFELTSVLQARELGEWAPRMQVWKHTLNISDNHSCIACPIDIVSKSVDGIAKLAVLVLPSSVKEACGARENFRNKFRSS